MARQAAESAVQHAIRCGDLLIRQKAELPHGEFMPWVVAHCQFRYSTAARYMKAAEQSSLGVEISALRQLFPSGRHRAAAPSESSPIVTRGCVTFGNRVDGLCVCVLFESERHRGHWYDINLRHGSIAARPIRSDGIRLLVEQEYRDVTVWRQHLDDGAFALWERQP